MKNKKCTILLCGIASAVLLFGCAASEAPTENNAVTVAAEMGEDPLFAQGLLPVCSDNKWGYVDASGAYVIAPEYDTAGRFAEKSGAQRS